MPTIHSIEMIVSDPAVRSGRPCLAGTGLRVTDVVIAHTFHDQSPDDIAVNYGVSLAAVYAALAYYYDNKTALDEDIRAQIKQGQVLKAQYGSDSLLS
jgi:uncharacterized protein (DUF433 family)